MFKRWVTLFLAASLVIGLLAFSFLSVHSSVSEASAHTSTAHVMAVSPSTGTIPPSWINHRIHLHPVSQPFTETVFFNVTGTGLPANTTLTFYSDFGITGPGERCDSNTVDGATVSVDADGTFSATPFSADDCQPGSYLIEAIDPLFRVYPAFLTVTS